jgi:exopolyphosphatase/guanosine-5'-triphosphate,3'-diphosphate pyrophosphatase
VAATALGIFDQAARGALEELRDRRDLLRRTAQLCEVGLSVSHDDYHRHSAYLLEHSDMPGFSASEQDRMALLALGHAGGLRKMRGRFGSELDTLMLFALRLSCILHRREDDQQAPLPAVFFRKSRLRFELPAKWTAAHPLTDHLLREEVALWTDARLLTEVSFTQI